MPEFKDCNFLTAYAANTVHTADGLIAHCVCGSFYLNTGAGTRSHRNQCDRMRDSHALRGMARDDNMSLTAGLPDGLHETTIKGLSEIQPTRDKSAHVRKFRGPLQTAAILNDEHTVADSQAPAILEAVDCGWRAGNDRNVCFYRAILGKSASDNDTLALKADLAPLANLIAGARCYHHAEPARGRQTDYSRIGVMAEADVAYAYAKKRGPLAIVWANSSLLHATLYWDSSKRDVEPIWLLHTGIHYQRLCREAPPSTLTASSNPRSESTLAASSNAHSESDRGGTALRRSGRVRRPSALALESIASQTHAQSTPQPPRAVQNKVLDVCLQSSQSSLESPSTDSDQSSSSDEDESSTEQDNPSSDLAPQSIAAHVQSTAQPPRVDRAYVLDVCLQSQSSPESLSADSDQSSNSDEDEFSSKQDGPSSDEYIPDGNNANTDPPSDDETETLDNGTPADGPQQGNLRQWLELYFDGGSRGNPGPGGAGAVVYYATEASAVSMAKVCTHMPNVDTTNNTAEYRGLISGLTAVREILNQGECPPLLLKVFGDSKLVLKQVPGLWLCNNANLRPLLRETRALITELRNRNVQLTFTHVPRDRNKEADAAANEAMDARRSTFVKQHNWDTTLNLLQRGTAKSILEPEQEEEQLDPPGTRRAVREPLTALPSEDALVDILKSMHVDSRILCRLPPARLWPSHFKRHWREQTKAFTPRLKAALDDGSELALLQILLDLLELPLLTFQEPLTCERTPASKNTPPPAIPDPLPNAASRPEHKAAVKRAYEDSWTKAMQAVLTNGIAPNTEDTFQQMDEMHRNRVKPLEPHDPHVDQVRVTTKQAKNFLFKAATNDRSCIDVFGWATDYLLHVRNTPFLRQLARLTAILANADVPESFAIVLTCGMLLPIHKEAVDKQRERLARGERVKLRPVNIGSCILKWGFKLALGSKPRRNYPTYKWRWE